MALTEKELIGSLKAGQFSPVYLLTGEENYYIDVVSDYFELNVIDESFRDFDQIVVYGRDVDMVSVVSLCKQFPMMSPYRLVLVKEAQDIPVKEWESLVAYLQNPLPQTLLVFCYRHKTLAKNTRAYKAIDKVGKIYESKKIPEYRLTDWIGSYVGEHGYSITQSSAALIAESVGNDLGKIVNELTKVFISLPKGGTINEDVVEREIGISKEYNVFELQKAIASRDVVRCNRIINHFAANPKNNPLPPIMAFLYGFFIKVMIYHQVPDKSDAAAAMKVSSYVLRDYEVAARNYSLGKLASCIGYLNEADLRSKGVGNANTITDGEILKELIFKIIH